MLPPSSQRKSSQKRDFDLGSHASHRLKNNPPKGRIPKRWDKNPVQEILPEGRIIDRILLIEGYLHVSTFYSGSSWSYLLYIQSGLILSGYFPLRLGYSSLIPHRWKSSSVWISGRNMGFICSIARV